MSRRWMITYDIGSDRVRARVRDMLNNQGTRVQYSVFECELTSAETGRLRTLLAEMIKEGDSIRWYPLCRWCRQRTIIQGQGDYPEFPDYFQL